MLNSTLNIFKLTNEKFQTLNLGLNGSYLYKPVWFGGYFFEMEPFELFEKNVDFIKKNTKWKRFAFFGIVGTTLQPEHYYGIFIENTINTIFIYNSCPYDSKNNKLEIDLVKRYKILNHFSSYSVIINKFQNQFRNELCGIFALKFLLAMTHSKEDPRVEFENNFNQNVNLDSRIEKYQEHIVVNRRDIKRSYLDDFFLKWF